MNNTPTTIVWSTAAPLWSALPPNGSGRAQFSRPAILRFAKDSFMDDFFKLLAGDPAQLQSFQAVYETWREPAPEIELTQVLSPAAQRAYTPAFSGRIPFNPARRTAALPALSPELQAKQKYLKLYQPAHERFYMVSACLVCQETGLPDRVLETNNFEKVSFVIRRLMRRPGSTRQRVNSVPDLAAYPDAWDEYAWVVSGKTGSWQRLTNPTGPLPENEERLPLFPVNYKDENSRRRRLLAGLIPVSKRDTYVNAPRINDPSTQAGQLPLDLETQPDRREVVFIGDVAGPWRNIVGMMVRKDRAVFLSAHDNGPSATQLNTMSAQIGTDIANQQQPTTGTPSSPTSPSG